jgi:hypothetical protein
MLTIGMLWQLAGRAETTAEGTAWVLLLLLLFCAGTGFSTPSMLRALVFYSVHTHICSDLPSSLVSLPSFETFMAPALDVRHDYASQDSG